MFCPLVLVRNSSVPSRPAFSMAMRIRVFLMPLTTTCPRSCFLMSWSMLLPTLLRSAAPMSLCSFRSFTVSSTIPCFTVDTRDTMLTSEHPHRWPHRQLEVDGGDVVLATLEGSQQI